ncbi:MAG: plasmid pRiA4b ORF-3 family protein [Bacteroidales bacterium]|nr:plasmid pRiA4b ORF-3 family protein [Bacteroidales bacterium]
MTKTAYQIQIALKGSKPKIWRRVLIPSGMLLSDLHYVIQIVMGWTNTHLHEFIHNGISYSEPDDEMLDGLDAEDSTSVKVFDLLEREKDSLIYEYDFGDSWEHQIILEKVLPATGGIQLPVCLDGKMNCPPEDSGGVWGYAEMLEILKQPERDEYEEYIDWLGDEFDPEYFDKDEVNQVLRGMKRFAEPEK